MKIDNGDIYFIGDGAGKAGILLLLPRLV